MQNIVLTHNMYTKPTYLHYIIHILLVHVIYKVKRKKVSANQKRASEKKGGARARRVTLLLVR